MNARRIIHGIYGGLAGGLVFGMIMGMMGMLPMIGKLVGQPSAEVGFIVHMVNSAVIGAAFALLFGLRAKGAGSGWRYGALYGVFWWFLGPLTLMPYFLGMGLGVNWNITSAFNMMPSLMGHVIYGVILGFIYGFLQSRVFTGRPARASRIDAAKS